MKYTLTRRNSSVTAANDVEFVDWMRKQDLQDWNTNKEFMEAYAHRKKTFEKIPLRSENEEAFVEDLIKNNMLTIEKVSGISILNIFKK